jgi:hypothetical protein
MKIFHPILVLLWLGLSLQAATTFYIATNGRDDWSGLLPAPNDAKTDGPFVSPARARDAVRALKKNGAAGPFAVELRGGFHALPETLVFTPQDSGTPQDPVIWRATPGEKAMMSGGRPIPGLTETSAGGKRTWKTTLPEVREGRWFFRQLFASPRGDGAFLRRYRPMIGMKLVAGLTGSPQRKAASHRAAQKDFVFYPGDIQAWANLSDVEVVALHEWSSSRLLIEKIDLAKNVVEFTGFPTFRIGHWWPGAHNPYYVENVKEALAKPGEWYLDRKSGEFTYLPMADESLSATRLVAPFLPVIVSLKGDYSNRAFVSHLMFSNLSFAHNESPLPREGYGGSQGHPDLPSAIELVGAERCAFLRCTIAHTGNYGLGLGLGCQENRVAQTRLFDLAGGGIKIGDIAMDVKAEYPVLPTGNTVENCAISDGGLLYYSANAIWAGIVRATSLRHNDIRDFTYAGIAVGWRWNDEKTSCASNLIENNLIQRVCTLLADGASIYTLGRQPGTIIRGNLLRDNVKSAFAREHWQLGLYLDEGSSEMLVENNIVHRVGTHGFNINGGAENLIRNNIFGPVYGNHGPFIRCFRKPYARSNHFLNNLSYCDSPNLADDAWDKPLFDFRSNLYWNLTGKPSTFRGKTLREWQAGGQDAGSVMADPLFENASKADYRLKKGSPATTIGFKPFPVKAGLEPAFADLAAPAPVSAPPVFGMRMPEIPESILAPAADAVSFKAKRLAAKPILDGVLAAGEWPESVKMEQTPMREKIATPAPTAAFGHDGKTLYCAVSVPCDPAKLKAGMQWGGSDGVELCLAAVKGTMLERVFVLHGYSGGTHESMTDAGAKKEAAKKFGDSVRHAAKVGDGGWVSEWAIPLSALGVKASPGTKLGVNLCVRRTETREWIMLTGTLGPTFQLYNAGYCVLE